MDVITGIRKERGKMRVTLNMEQDILVPISLFRERPLAEGQSLDIEEYGQWLLVRQYRHALDRAVVYLTARARSRRELERAFLNEYRLNAAAEALQATDETVLTIASRCGFENLSYFNRAFKAHFGMTPREYRKK